MAKATWAGKTIADSNSTVEVEGNQYFPPRRRLQKFPKAQQSHQRMPVERHRPLLSRRSRRHEKRKCRLVLPRTQARRLPNQRPRGLLEGHPHPVLSCHRLPTSGRQPYLVPQVRLWFTNLVFRFTSSNAPPPIPLNVFTLRPRQTPPNPFSLPSLHATIPRIHRSPSGNLFRLRPYY